MEDIQKRLETEEDFINLRRYGFSLKVLLDKYPNGCPDHIIAAALNLTEDELEIHHQKIISCLRHQMVV